MKKFVEVNILSIICALQFWIPMELETNILRVGNIFHITIEQCETVITILCVLCILLCSIGSGIYICRYLSTSWMRYLSAILWLPYAFAFMWAFAILFPINDPSLEASPATGLVILGAVIFYPFYVLILNYISPIVRCFLPENEKQGVKQSG